MNQAKKGTEINYVFEIADQFRRCCCRTAILTPMDFAIIAEWGKQEIPLSIVLTSIEDFCGKKNVEIGSIAEIQDKVKQDFIRWLQTRSDRRQNT